MAFGATALAGMFLAQSIPQTLSAKDWDVFEVNGRQYVSDENVARFYGFEHFEKQDDESVFKHPSLLMTWKIGTDSIYVNKLRFLLSFPVIENGDMALLSTVDLAKLVDPVIRPSYISTPIEFDTVVVDPGHGGEDSGIRGLYGWEKNYTLDLALRFADKLAQLGLKARLTRQADRTLSVQERVEEANKIGESIFISLHFGAEEESAHGGIRTFALAPQGTSTSEGGSSWNTALAGNDRDAENIALATAVHSYAINNTNSKSPDLGVRRARFNVLRGIEKPAVLFDGGSLTHPDDASKIASESYREELAQALALAVSRFKTTVGKKQFSSSPRGKEGTPPNLLADPHWPGYWNAVFFNWTAASDPVAHLESWRQLAQTGTAAKADATPLELDYGSGGPSDLLEPIQESKLQPDRFGMIAATRMHLGKGAHRFEVFADDGVRVWVAGRLLIDGWSYPRRENLSAIWEQGEDGAVDVKVEHFENEGLSTLMLSIWHVASESRVDTILPRRPQYGN